MRAVGQNHGAITVELSMGTNLAKSRRRVEARRKKLFCMDMIDGAILVEPEAGAENGSRHSQNIGNNTVFWECRQGLGSMRWNGGQSDADIVINAIGHSNSTHRWSPRIPRETGHAFHPKLDGDSTGNWTDEVAKRRAGRAKASGGARTAYRRSIWNTGGTWATPRKRPGEKRASIRWGCDGRGLIGRPQALPKAGSPVGGSGRRGARGVICPASDAGSL